MSILEKKFGTLPTGEDVTVFRLLNESGAYADVIDYGAIVVKVVVPDKYNNMVDVVLGYDNVKQYTVNKCFFGAIIGRNGNRIANGKFEIKGRSFQLPTNENENNLHSGPVGFEKHMWNVTAKDEDKNCITFSRLSPDGEMGFPGNFNVSVTYEFTADNELKIIYDAVCDQDTVANMTNHSYFNLNGEGNGSVLGQYLKLNCTYYTPVIDAKYIPTGEIAPVAGTVMDFSVEKKIGRDINADFEQLAFTGGYDHNYVADNYEKGVQRTIATAYSDLT
ncbi:MAG: galactose mutarotase, partial [Clostridiales bacterium]|nr:galactose mutarotase [Candidatus Blautia equi]